MTTTRASQRGIPAVADDRPRFVTTRLRWVLRAEWTKLLTVPATPWLLLAVVAFTVIVSVGTVGSVDTSQCPAPTECFEDTVKLTLTGVWLAQAAVVVLAVLVITNEYGTGMIQTTFAAMPRRITVLMSKAAALVIAVLMASSLGVLGSVLVGRIILPNNGFTAANGYPALSLGDGPTMRAAVGTVLYCALVALMSLGFGTLIRETAGALTTMLGIVYVLPVVATLVSDPAWATWLERLTPTNAGLAVQATIGLDEAPIGPWAGLGVLAAYAAAALVAASLSLRVRDA